MKLQLFLFLLLFSCKAKNTTEDDLKTAMQNYLYSRVNNDSSSVKYRVKNITYYDDNLRNQYVCIFTVELKEDLINTQEKRKTHIDTTGEMKAYISRDLKTVKRLY